MYGTRFSLLLVALTLTLCSARVDLTTQASADHVLNINARDFKQFVKKKRDDITLVLLLTASTSRCEYCGVASNLFAEGTKIIKRSSKESGVVKDSENRSIVFAEIDLLKNVEIGRMLGLADVPHLYVLNSKNVNCSKDSCNLSAKDLLGKSGSSSVHKLFDGVLRELGRHDIWERDFKPWELITRPRLAAAGVTVVLCLIPFLARISKILNAHMWIVGATATIIYALSTSGIIYNWQNNAWYYFGQDMYGARTFMHPSSRSQYLAEGLVFSFANVVISGSFYTIANLLKRESKGFTKSVIALTLTAALIFVYLQVCTFVQRKVGYIMYPLLPPDDSYSTGGPRRDKRYTT